MSDVVRHNLDTHRVVTGCECGRTVTFPDSGISKHHCACGRVWTCDGDSVAMYEPKAWREWREIWEGSDGPGTTT